ncbi:MAG: tRNA (adenosine(37)-N6)-threonylcarbamoyltransferase complex ATPase subunit type 1 TsaE [Candidatus Omnitrophica bacterium]|nr:tRNA (adenosine(37)-N6)-threonylcarbamoyltransferase complex ATPase subunit type 1 TsaE [Candidatus Omnitrophota bacterium]
MYIKSFSKYQTLLLGESFSRFLKPKDLVILEGQLGAGKTTFVKGILKGFGIRKTVISPTFILIREYKKRDIYIYHVDLYRLEKKDIDTIGLEDILYRKDSIVLIEWGDKISNLLSEHIKVKFNFLDINSRQISFYLNSISADRRKIFNEYLAALKNEFIRN